MICPDLTLSKSEANHVDMEVQVAVPMVAVPVGEKYFPRLCTGSVSVKSMRRLMIRVGPNPNLT